MNIQKNAVVATFPIAGFRTKDLLWTIAFVFAATISPAIFAHTPQNQWITGTIVNAILYLAVWRVGLINAMLIAAIPSSIALLRGLLPAPMAVVIPYIILSNIVMIFVFYSAKKHRLAGVLTASFAKFLFLFTITSFFIQIDFPLISMMQWPQLATALAGGLIAFGITKTAKSSQKINNA